MIEVRFFGFLILTINETIDNRLSDEIKKTSELSQRLLLERNQWKLRYIEIHKKYLEDVLNKEFVDLS